MEGPLLRADRQAPARAVDAGRVRKAGAGGGAPPGAGGSPFLPGMGGSGVGRGKRFRGRLGGGAAGPAENQGGIAGGGGGGRRPLRERLRAVRPVSGRRGCAPCEKEAGERDRAEAVRRPQHLTTSQDGRGGVELAEGK